MPDEQKEKIGARLKAFVRRSGLSQAESGQAQGFPEMYPFSHTHFEIKKILHFISYLLLFFRYWSWIS